MASTILAVDDSPEIHRLLDARLQDEGVELLHALDGTEALSLVQQRLPDLVLLDVDLPGLDGFEVCGWLKGDPRTRDIPVVFLTGIGDAEAKARGLNLGAVDFVNKPFDPSELRARIRATLQSTSRLQQLQSQTRSLAMLYDFASELQSMDSEQAIGEAAVDMASRITNSRRVSLMLLDESGTALRMACSKGMEQGRFAGDWRCPVGHGIAGKAMSLGRPILVNTPRPTAASNGCSATVFQSAPGYASEYFASTPLVAVPLDGRERPVGVLNVTDRSDGRPYSDDEIHELFCIAKTCALALSNLRERQNSEQARDALIVGLAALAERRDGDTGSHLRRLSRYARVVAEELARRSNFGNAITPQFIADLCRFIPLHDIGKVGIPDSILLKPGKLTAEEFEVMKTHCEIGAHTLRTVAAQLHDPTSLEMAIEIAASHHEKYDGTGYPYGTRGAAIPLAARVAAIIDVYDALTSDRPYHLARPHADVVEYIAGLSGRHFDGEIVSAFLAVAPLLPGIRQQADAGIADAVDTAACNPSEGSSAPAAACVALNEVAIGICSPAV